MTDATPESNNYNKLLAQLSIGTREITFSAEVEALLAEKIANHNRRSPESLSTNIKTIRAVYRRGANDFFTSYSNGISRSEHGLLRVDAYLHLLRAGSPKNSYYTSDNDLLPISHPARPLTAAAADVEYELTASNVDGGKYPRPESAIIALTEYSGMGYEAEHAIRASWLRGVRAGEDPFTRAALLASFGYDSIDGDLLPKVQEGTDSE